MISALRQVVFAGELAADCWRSDYRGCGRAAGKFLALCGAGHIGKSWALYRLGGDDFGLALKR